MAILAVESRVHAVTVYRTGALVTRRAELARGADGYPEAVRVTGLPLALDDGSMRVRVGNAEAGELPIATGLRVALDVPDAGAAMEPPADLEIAEAKRRVLRVQAVRERLSAEIELLRGLKSPARPAGAEGEPPPPVPTAARLALLGFRHEELEKRQAEWRASSAELTAAQEGLAELERRRERATTARPARENELRKSAVIELAARAAGAGRAWLELEYLVPGARWVPAYALELDAECARGTLAVRALVCQATGEDWPGVALRVSTADAQAWAELPELTSVRIGRRQPGRRGWVPPPAGADALYADFDRARRPPSSGRDEKVFAGLDVEGAPQPMMEMAVMAKAAPLGDAPRGGRGPHRRDAEGGVAQSAPMAPMAQPAPMAPMPGGAMMRAAASATMAGGVTGKVRAIARPADDLRPAREMLEYGRLRLAAEGPGRGQLAPVAVAVEYAELLAELRVHLAVDVTGEIRRAIQRAKDAGVNRPAGRYGFPGSQDGFDYAYKADFPLDVPSDGEFHGVTLALREGPAELKHVCVPRETADVFRVASMVNPLDAPLLPGPVDVSVAGEFRLTAPLGTVPARARLELGLGVEPAIKVARNTRYREETGGLMSTSLTLEHEIAIEVVNHLKRRAALEVRERVPVARQDDDQATVTIGQVTPPWRDYLPKGQELRGGHAWHVMVEPGDKLVLKAVYNVSISSKNELVGGNRREG